MNNSTLGDTQPPKRRCAVYTRKSHADGLDQDYNSIDAQKDAGHAYISSQRSEGWISVDDDYDDPAYSGGNMERPALQRLMEDIQAGKVNTVIVYKIDRLTRSLTDFAKMIDVFDGHNVSFCSVTQQFNTTTSMGRLTLNILLSFAQFEREVTGERIRDKFAASKKKGIWMGGIPPLGYDVADRLLVANNQETEVIRRIFSRYVELGSATNLAKELALDNITTKSWTTQNGNRRSGKLIDRGNIYKILANQTYIGKIRHKTQWYDGRHGAIIEQSVWDAAQETLQKNTKARSNTKRIGVPFLLKGIVFDCHGRALTPWSTVKKKSGRRYRYYISAKDNKEYTGASGLPRFPASILESAVIEQLRNYLRSPEILLEMARTMQSLDEENDEAQVTVAMTKVDQIWEQLFPAEQSRIVHLLLEKIVVGEDKIELRFRNNGIETLASELSA